MKPHKLDRLVDLRERELERLRTSIAAKESVRSRYQSAIARLDDLYAGTGASGALSPLLALNCSAFKQSVLELATTQRETLASHEADMAVTQQALLVAAKRHKVLDQVVQRQQAIGRRALSASEQRRQDEVASQMWQRRGA